MMSPLKTYLVGIVYHEPGPLALWNRGAIEDYESATGVFIDASSREEAIAWGESIGQAAIRLLNSDDSLDWKSFGHHVWIADPTEKNGWPRGWPRDVSNFQRVEVGEMPDLRKFSHES